MMASDDKKIKTNPAPKSEAPPKNKSTSDVDPSKAEGGEIAAPLPSGYSRGEGQKPVSKAYKDNWNVIFAKKKSDNSSNGAGVAVARRGAAHAAWASRLADVFNAPPPLHSRPELSVVTSSVENAPVERLLPRSITCHSAN
jgi:hypothetical protein